MTPQEFVTLVLSNQEQTILDDFWPSDDIYRMVLLNANMVIDEFQDQTNWGFLRRRLVLGDTNRLHPGDHSIPEYKLPKWVDRVCTQYQDRVTLHRYHHHHHHDHEICLNDIDNRHYLEVPFQSRGAGRHMHYDFGNTLDQVPDPVEPLRALVIGDIVTFNRPLLTGERHRAAVVDVQEKIPHIHVCGPNCTEGKNPDKPISYERGNDYNPCKHIEDNILDFPGADYIVLKTATYSADGSEIAQDKAMKLADRAKMRLSKLQELDSSFTEVDQIEFEPFNMVYV